MESIQIRGLNSDHHGQVTQLIRLYQENYGADFTIPSVYTPGFWQNSHRLGFVNILAFDGKELIGHCALRAVDKSYQQVEISLLAWNITDFTSLELQVQGQALRAFLERFGYARGNEALCFSAPLRFPAVQKIAQSVLGLYPVAVLPGFCALYARLFDRSSGEAPNYGKIIYPASVHRNICSTIYEELGLPVIVGNGDYYTDDADQFGARRGIEKLNFRRYSSALFFVEPHQYGNAELLRRFQNINAIHEFLAVNICHANSSSFCAELEEKGFRFQGVIPRRRGAEYVVYAYEPWFIPAPSVYSPLFSALEVPRDNSAISEDLSRSTLGQYLSTKKGMSLPFPAPRHYFSYDTRALM